MGQKMVAPIGEGVLRWISFVILLVAISEVSSVCPLNRCPVAINSPCGIIKPGTSDLPVFDLIREFHLDEGESRYEGVTETLGSIQTQRAYHLDSSSNLTINTWEAFPRGLPAHFSFECTFRAREQPPTPWYLFHVTNRYEDSQLSVIMDPAQQVIGIGLPDVSGHVQRVFFQHASLFDRSWHKVMLSVQQDQATLWVDCIPVPGIRGGLIEPLLPRRTFDTSGGHIYLSRLTDQSLTTSTTALIDLQWMVLSCDSTRPTKQNCDELPQYQQLIPNEPEVVLPPNPIMPQPQCEITCPQGPPGIDGRPGPPGPPGEPGILQGIGYEGLKGEKGEQGIVGPPGEPGPVGLFGERGERGEKGFQGERGLIGQKGEPGLDGLPGVPGPRGEPGYVITKFEGETHEYGFSEVQIRDICASVLREQIDELRPSLIGPEGPAGPPGKSRPGRPGAPGAKGEAGHPGTPGLPGFQGPKGHQGLQGERGEKGQRGEDGVGRPGAPGPQGIQGNPGNDIIGPPGHPGDRGEEGRPGSPGPRGEAGPPGQCPSDCYYTQMYMQQLQAAHQQQANSKGPSPLQLNVKG